MKHTHYFTTAAATLASPLATTAVADNGGHDDDSDRDRGKAPLVKEQGSFAFGGAVITNAERQTLDRAS